MRDFESVGLSPSAAALPSNADVTVERAARQQGQKRGHEDRARRVDVFDALREGMGEGAYDAARRLERDIVTAAGEHDRGRFLGRVDGDGGKDRTDQMIDASARVVFVLARVGRMNADLLSELIQPSPVTRLCGPHWRNVVALIAREGNPHAQCAVVRAACANLVGAYAAWEAEQRRSKTSVAA